MVTAQAQNIWGFALIILQGLATYYAWRASRFRYGFREWQQAWYALMAMMFLTALHRTTSSLLIIWPWLLPHAFSSIGVVDLLIIPTLVTVLQFFAMWRLGTLVSQSERHRALGVERPPGIISITPDSIVTEWN